MKPATLFKNILVFNSAYLGDTVLTTPLLASLRKLYPDAKITFMVRPEHLSLYESFSLIDKALPYDKRGEFKSISGTIAFAKIIQAANYDLIINLHKSFRTGLLFFFTKASFIVGFSSAKLSFFFDKRVKGELALHEAERNLNILSAITTDYSLKDAKTFAGPLILDTDLTLKSKIKTFQSRISVRKKTVGISVGSIWDTKRYPAIYFAEVAHNLYRAGYNIALFGTAADKDVIESFKQYYKSPYFDYVDKLTLNELPTFLSALDLFITNDSGPLHIAVAAKIPVIAIFGPTVKEQGFYPYDKISTLLEVSIKCRPCSAHGGKRCPKNHFKCMKDLAPDLVYNTAIKYLENK